MRFKPHPPTEPSISQTLKTVGHSFTAEVKTKTNLSSNKAAVLVCMRKLLTAAGPKRCSGAQGAPDLHGKRGVNIPKGHMAGKSPTVDFGNANVCAQIKT